MSEQFYFRECFVVHYITDLFNWLPAGQFQPANQFGLARPWVQNTNIYSILK